MKHEGDGDTNNSQCALNGPQRFGKNGESGNQRKDQDHPDNSIVEISKNTEKSPGDRNWLFTRVIYWPSIKPSIKRCTCVNKRKNSGSRWTSDNYITRCPRRSESVEVSWRQDAELRARGRQRSCGPQWPTVEQPNQDAKEVLLWSKELWVNIAVYPRLQLISHTQPTSTLSIIKVREIILL